MRKIIGWMVTIVLVALGIVYFLPEIQQVSASPITDNEIHYEIPCLKAERSQQIIEHIGYTVSYNHDWLLPNWVAYELTSAEVDGEEQRTNKFLPDPQVIGSPVVTQDYKGSGYDRGHMAPAADMKWSAQAMRESFYMTNICPQNHNNNAGDWKSLEELARDWADKYGSIYICVGPIVPEHPQYIGNERQIAVPSAFYKAFLRRKGDSWTAIGFMMPNAAGSRPLMTYMQTINDLEEITSIDFFPNLPDSIEEQAESDYTISDWSL
ncbi:MAG: DNA/RNA non-specific endonuclease [Paludibacteraceae bacterium]|nr:DNA/RNA non-specific endonuclease [Paludibacteraceae bacterium]